MLTRRYHRLRSVDCHCTGIQVIRYLMPLIKKANRTRRKCIHHFKLAAGWLAAWRSRIQAAAAAARTHGEGAEPSEKMESTGERQAQRQKGQGRQRGRRICESFPFTRPPPQSRPCQPFPLPRPPLNLPHLPPPPAESGPLCRAVGELTFHRLPSAALIISPAGVTARGLRWRGSRKPPAERWQEVM